MYTYSSTRVRLPGHTEPDESHRRGHAPDVGSVAEAVRRVRAAFAMRHDAYVRRAIAERHDVLAHHREVGGDFSVLP